MKFTISKTNIVLFISALLLLAATTVLGERGSASRVKTMEIDAMGNERNLAVGRPTPSPVSAKDGKGSAGDDDDDDDDDDGKGGSGDDDDDDDDDDGKVSISNDIPVQIRFMTEDGLAHILKPCQNYPSYSYH